MCSFHFGFLSKPMTIYPIEIKSTVKVRRTKITPVELQGNKRNQVSGFHLHL